MSLSDLTNGGRSGKNNNPATNYLDYSGGHAHDKSGSSSPEAHLMNGQVGQLSQRQRYEDDSMRGDLNKKQGFGRLEK